MRKEIKRAAGFTLLEVMVVIIIIGLLATMVLPKVIGRTEEAYVAKAKSDISALSSQLKMYKLDNYSYPTTDQGLQALVTKPDTEPEARNWKGYIERLPKDPWGIEYHYLQPGEHGDFDIWSTGADAKDGGEGNNKDITSWELDN